MKNLVIVVGLILASLLIAPKFIGSMVENDREKLLVKLNEVDGFTLITNQYHTAWFGADVTSELTFSLEQDGLADITLLLEEELTFGPIIITSQGWHLGLGYSAVKFKFSAGEVDEAIIKLINEKIHLGALLSFNNELTSFIKTDEISYQDGDTSLVSAPASAQFTLTDDTSLAGQFSWGGLELKELGERFVIGKVIMSTQQKVVSGDYLQGTAILTGDASFNVEKMDMYSQASHVFSLADAGLTTAVSLDNDLLALTLSYYAKSISASGQNFEKPNLDIVLANIDIHALQELNTMIASMSVNGLDTASSEEIVQALSAVAEKVLANNPSLKVTDLSIVTDEGKIASELNFTINKDLFDMSNVNSMAFFMALEADAKGKAPIAFLTKLGVAPMVNSFVEQGYLSEQDDDISFKATYIENQLTVNGKAFQL
jgi:uncharacterized protein YdgA (DUF945 family)